jgi:hypothetical protein
LNAAFISKTDTAEQSLSGYLKLGGKLTLKTGGSAISDDFNASYMQIDPQGSHLALYDGANNMKLSVYASNGAKSTYLTSVDTTSVGQLDVLGMSRLEIATNSSAPTLFGGNIMFENGNAIQAYDGTTTKNAIKIFGMNSNGAGILIGAGGATVVGSGESADTLLAGLTLNYSTESTYITADQDIFFYPNQNSGWTSAYNMKLGSNGTLTLTGAGGTALDINDANSYAQIILRATTGTTERKWAVQSNETDGSFRINEDATSSAARITILEGGNVGIGKSNPAYTLDVAGTLNASGTISAIGAGDITLDATDSSTATLTIKKAGSTIGTIGTNTLGGQKISHFVFNSAGTQSRSINLTYYDGNATKGGLIELPALLSWSSGTAAMDLNDSDIIGVNSIYFYGTSEPNEGLYFLKYGKTSDSQTLADYNVMRVDGNGTGYIGGNIISTDNVGGTIAVTRDSNDKIYTVVDTPASGNATTVTVTSRDTNGRISVATEVINGVTFTYTVTRDPLTGKVSSIART